MILFSLNDFTRYKQDSTILIDHLLYLALLCKTKHFHCEYVLDMTISLFFMSTLLDFGFCLCVMPCLCVCASLFRFFGVCMALLSWMEENDPLSQPQSLGIEAVLMLILMRGFVMQGLNFLKQWSILYIMIYMP